MDRGSLLELTLLEFADEGGEIGIFVDGFVDLILKLSGGPLQGTGIDPEHSYSAVITPGEEDPGWVEPCIACQFPQDQEAS